jgi:hypothetical protein
MQENGTDHTANFYCTGRDIQQTGDTSWTVAFCMYPHFELVSLFVGSMTTEHFM